jgi:hypothetical protein
MVYLAFPTEVPRFSSVINGLRSGHGADGRAEPRQGNPEQDEADDGQRT